MNIWIIAFFLGICSAIFWPQIPSLFWLIALPIIFGIWFFVKNRKIVSQRYFKNRAITYPVCLISLLRALLVKQSRKIYGLSHLINSIRLAMTNIELFLYYLLIFTIGFCWVLIYVHWIARWSLSKEIEGKKVVITGYIASLPVINPGYASFEFKTLTINNEKISTKLKLSWYQKYLSNIHPGDKWQFLVKLKRVHGTANPGGFDSERHLFVHKIRATGYVVSDGNYLPRNNTWIVSQKAPQVNLILSLRVFFMKQSRKVLKKLDCRGAKSAPHNDETIQVEQIVASTDINKVITSNWWNYPLTRFRHNLIIKMQKVLADYKLAPVIIALVTGSEHHITQEQWRVMRSTGTSYLVAISGLHIGLVASIVLALVQFLWRQSRKLPLILPAKEAGVIFGLVVGFIYGAISGFSIPTQRALVMLTSFSLITLMRRNTPLWNAWLWSVFLILLLDPLAVLTIGFWLSFGAVATILYASGWRIRAKSSHLANFWRMQLIVTLGLLPFTLLFFQQFSVATLIANLLAMPGVCLIVVPISLLGAIVLFFSNFLGNWILILSIKILTIIWYWLTLWSNFPWANWYHPIYNNWVLFASIIGILLLLAPKGFPGRYLGLVWLMPLFFYVPPKPKNNQVWFTLLDVGQGLAAVVQTANHVLLYDTGPKFFTHDAGSSTITPYLRLQGVKTLDMLLVSHGDLDHIGGAEVILQSFKVNNILTSAPEKFTTQKAYMCSSGQHWQWDGVDFTVLSPSPGANFTGNEASCVLRVSSGNNSILLVGDVEHAAERKLVDNYGANLKSAILVAAHHGSNTSSTQNFVDLVAPKYVLYPIGYRNRFHFPSKKVVARFTDLGAEQLDTAASGAITFKFTNKSDILHPEIYRKIAKHFWNY